MDGEAYAFYLEDLAGAARELLGNGPVRLYHDGVRWHDSPPPRDAMQKLNIISLGKPPPRSPDINPIENLFGIAAERLSDKWAEERPKDSAETERRFGEICDEAEAAGEILRLVESMPRRMAAVLDADGGPTKY